MSYLPVCWEFHRALFQPPDLAEALPQELAAFFEGRDSGLLRRLESLLLPTDLKPDPWLSALYEEDLELLEGFFPQGSLPMTVQETDFSSRQEFLAERIEKTPDLV